MGFNSGFKGLKEAVVAD